MEEKNDDDCNCHRVWTLPGPCFCFWKLFWWGKMHRHQVYTYSWPLLLFLEALLVREDAQTPSVYLFLALAFVSGSSSGEGRCTDTKCIPIPGPCFCFWKLFWWGKIHRHQVYISSWPLLLFLEALLLREDAQTPSVYLFLALAFVSGSSSAEGRCTDTKCVSLPGPCFCFWKLFWWGKMHRHQCLVKITLLAYLFGAGSCIRWHIIVFAFLFEMLTLKKKGLAICL